jgi:chemotaxis protein methyltransferase CheR
MTGFAGESGGDSAPRHPAVSPADLAALGSASEIPLAAYRPEHVVKCVQRALARNGVPDTSALAVRLSRDSGARSDFRRSVLVGVTSMFRDEQEFALLERQVLPELLARRPKLNVWSAGCSTGEELWSVALLLERRGALAGAGLLGTDVLAESLAVAAAGPPDVPAAARAAVRFERRDLVRDPPPPGAFDLVLCRNVAMYLRQPEQRRLHRRLAGALRPHGYLMLGRSETLLHPGLLGLTAVSRHVFRGGQPCGAGLPSGRRWRRWCSGCSPSAASGR